MIKEATIICSKPRGLIINLRNSTLLFFIFFFFFSSFSSPNPLSYLLPSPLSLQPSLNPINLHPHQTTPPPQKKREERREREKRGREKIPSFVFSSPKQKKNEPINSPHNQAIFSSTHNPFLLFHSPKPTPPFHHASPSSQPPPQHKVPYFHLAVHFIIIFRPSHQAH